MIVDRQLPVRDGLELRRRVPHEIPMIAVTARSARSDVIEDMHEGFDDYITKPFDNDILVARITRPP